MEQLVLFIKSYRPDCERAEKLLRSIERYNVDRLPVWLAVNDDDYAYFRQRVAANVRLLRDGEIVRCGIADGWVYQQVVKSQLHRLNECENYLCLDSDGEFIRDFFRTDFMYDDRTPYTVMHENKALFDTLELLGHKTRDSMTSRALAYLRPRFGTHGKNWDYGPSPYLWSTRVWRHFTDEYLAGQGHTLESFLVEMQRTTSAAEAVCYGEYLWKTRLIDIVPAGEFFKVYHYREQFELESERFDLARLRSNYLGVIFQSNWQGKRRRRFWPFGR